MMTWLRQASWSRPLPSASLLPGSCLPADLLARGREQEQLAKLGDVGELEVGASVWHDSKQNFCSAQGKLSSGEIVAISPSGSLMEVTAPGPESVLLVSALLKNGECSSW